MDHFARPGDAMAEAAAAGALRRNFQGYVVGDAPALIGLGPSAISTLPQGFAQNASEVGAWRRAIAAGRLATARGHALTPEDRLRAQIIEDLMCRFAVDLGPYGGAARFAAEIAALMPLARDGLVRIDGARLAIPDAMRPFCRLVAQAFDAYAAARHSAAV
jgi:oxygen-independent coproporphyrinogen-3 oxidase